LEADALLMPTLKHVMWMVHDRHVFNNIAIAIILGEMMV
jgi:hypothetical protein